MEFKSLNLKIFGIVFLILSNAYAAEQDTPHISAMQFPSKCFYRSGAIEKSVNCADYDYQYFKGRCENRITHESLPGNISNICRFNDPNAGPGWAFGNLTCKKVATSYEVRFTEAKPCDKVETVTIHPNQRYLGPNRTNRYENSAPSRESTYTVNANGSYTSFTSTGFFEMPASGLAISCYTNSTNGVPTNPMPCQTLSVNDVGFCELYDCLADGSKCKVPVNDTLTIKYKDKWWVRWKNGNRTGKQICYGGIDYYNVTSGTVEGENALGTMETEVVSGSFSWGDRQDYQVTACITSNGKRFSCKNSDNVDYANAATTSNCAFRASDGSGACADTTKTYGPTNITTITQFKSQVIGIGAGDCVRMFKTKTGTSPNLTVSNPVWRRHGGTAGWQECSQIEMGKLVYVDPDTVGSAIDPATSSVTSSIDANSDDKIFSVYNSGNKILSMSGEGTPLVYSATFPMTTRFSLKDFNINVLSSQIDFDSSASTQTSFSFNKSINVTDGNITITTGNLTLSGGNVEVSGTIHASSAITADSDFRFKKDLKNLSNPLEKVLKLKGLNYKFKTDEFNDRNFSPNLQSGLIAQDTEKQIPEIVEKGKDGYYSINYIGVIPYLIEGIKALHHNVMTKLQSQEATAKTLETRIDKLEKENKDLKQRVEKLESKK